MSDAETTSPAIAPEAAAELRHEMRTPVNHIIGYAEMLQEDSAVGSPIGAALTEILAIARAVLERINAALPPSGVTSEANLDGLLKELVSHQRRLLHCTTQLTVMSADDLFSSDVAKIAVAAHKLTNPPRPEIGRAHV